MKYRTRTFYSEAQKSEMWDRWQRGESISSIGRSFGRASASIFPHLARTGGIRPPSRVRSRLALTLSKREEMSRGLAADLSMRATALDMAQAPSTIRREVGRNGGRKGRSRSRIESARAALREATQSLQTLIQGTSVPADCRKLR